MPITVKHEADIGGLAGLSALVGALSRSEQPRIPVAGRGGGGGGRIQAPVMLPGIPSYEDLPHQLQRQEIAGQQQQMMMRADLERQEAMRQEELKREEESWVWEFTPQQKHEMTKNRNSAQMVTTGMHTGEIDHQLGMRQLEQLNIEYAAYTKQKRPRNSGDPPPCEPGKEPGKLWPHPEFGGLYRTSAKTGDVEVVVRPDQMPQHQAIQVEAKRQTDISSFRQKIVGMTRKEMNEAGDVTERPLDATERRDELEYAFPELKQERLAEEEQKWEQKVADSLADKAKQIDRAFKEGKIKVGGKHRVNIAGKQEASLDDTVIPLEEADRDLPFHVGKAQATVRHLIKEYGKFQDIPEKYVGVFLEAAEILENFDQRKQ